VSGQLHTLLALPMENHCNLYRDGQVGP